MSGAVSAGPAVTIATAPAPTVAASIAGSLRWRSFALRFDGRADLPASAEIAAGGRVSTNTAVAALSSCLRGALVFACGGFGVGVVFSETVGIARPAKDSAPFASAIGRVGLNITMGSRVYLEPSLEAGLSPARHRVVVDGATAYEMAPVGVTAHLHLGTIFF